MGGRYKGWYTNNFYGYFPNVGHHRINPCEFKLKMIHSLDSLLVKNNFDFEKFAREVDLWQFKMQKVKNLCRCKQSSEIELLRGEVEEHILVVQEMIYPIYLKMLELGYTRKELIS